MADHTVCSTGKGVAVDKITDFLLLFLAQFSGGPGPPENNLVRFGLAAIFWGVLLYGAWSRQRRADLPREKLLVFGFGLGFLREIFMLGRASLRILSPTTFQAASLVMEPIEHALVLASMVVISGSFLRYILDDAVLARRFLRIGLGLTAVGEPIPPEAIAWLINLQSTEEGLDGSWDDGFGTVGNADATAVALMALHASGTTDYDDNIARASAFLAAARLETGGWEYGVGFGQNGNSTALVVQTIGAMGIDFHTTDSAAPSSDIMPLDALLSYQSETGAFQADFGDGPFDDFLTTVQAIPAVASVMNSAPMPVLISEPVEEPAAEPTAEPAVEEPTTEPTAVPEPELIAEPEPTAVPPTAVPEPTAAPVVEEAVPELISETAPPEEAPSSTLPIILVVLALVAVVGGAYWYLKK